MTARASKTHTQIDTGDLNNTLAKTVMSRDDIEKPVDEFYEDLTTTWYESFRTQPAQKTPMTNMSVPWWNEELTTMRKRLNALRRRYQTTTNNEDLRAQRKAQYLEGKAWYTSTIKNEKFRSWKEFCNITLGNNPWNEVYKIAASQEENKSKPNYSGKNRRLTHEGHS